MGKIKYILIIIIIYILYKGYTSIKDFDLAITKKVEEIAKIEDVEKESTVIGLMMYLGYPLELHEHLLMSSKDKCFEKKEIAETNSFATYECAEVNAVVKDEKIISIIEEIRVLEWSMMIKIFLQKF